MVEFLWELTKARYVGMESYLQVLAEYINGFDAHIERVRRTTLAQQGAYAMKTNDDHEKVVKFHAEDVALGSATK